MTSPSPIGLTPQTTDTNALTAPQCPSSGSLNHHRVTATRPVRTPHPMRAGAVRARPRKLTPVTHDRPAVMSRIQGHAPAAQITEAVAGFGHLTQGGHPA